MNRFLVFLCCILLLGASLCFGTAPAQAKWWQIFHRHKTDSTDQTQSLPPPAPAVGSSSTSSGSFLPPSSSSSSGGRGAAPALSAPLSSGSSVTPTAAVPTLEPPPLPDRPPIPAPPQVACPAPLGSGVAKPALAWRAKSLRQLNLGSSGAGVGNSSNLPLLASASTVAVAPMSSALNGPMAVVSQRTYKSSTSNPDGGIYLSKTFAAKFDDTFMAAVLAMGQAGLNVRSMDSAHGKIEGVSPDPRLRFSVWLQLNRDLLDTTSVSCYCAATNTESKVLVVDVLSNINVCLKAGTGSGGAKVTGLLNAGQQVR